jgi:hypothetical protein
MTSLAFFSWPIKSVFCRQSEWAELEARIRNPFLDAKDSIAAITLEQP